MELPASLCGHTRSRQAAPVIAEEAVIAQCSVRCRAGERELKADEGGGRGRGGASRARSGLRARVGSRACTQQCVQVRTQALAARAVVFETDPLLLDDDTHHGLTLSSSHPALAPAWTTSLARTSRPTLSPTSSPASAPPSEPTPRRSPPPPTRQRSTRTTRPALLPSPTSTMATTMPSEPSPARQRLRPPPPPRARSPSRATTSSPRSSRSTPRSTCPATR